MREHLRTLRYRLSGRGSVFFYTRTDVERLASEAGLQRSRIVPIESSGSGFVLVGEGRHDV